jgi:hypothetical protein
VDRASLNKGHLLCFFFSVIILTGCGEFAIHDVDSLLFPNFYRSKVVGFVAGLGTTFVALPDLIGMLKRRSSKGMNPRMAAIMGYFPNFMGLLRVVDPFKTCHPLKYYRGDH